MGAHSSKFTPGLKPTDGDRPQRHEKYGEIKKAYTEAVNYVNKYKDSGYCTIGPGNWVKYWIKEEKETPLDVEEVEENIILCYHDKLKIKFSEEYLQKMTATKYDE